MGWSAVKNDCSPIRQSVTGDQRKLNSFDLSDLYSKRFAGFPSRWKCLFDFLCYILWDTCTPGCNTVATASGASHTAPKELQITVTCCVLENALNSKVTLFITLMEMIMFVSAVLKLCSCIGLEWSKYCYFCSSSTFMQHFEFHGVWSRSCTRWDFARDKCREGTQAPFCYWLELQVLECCNCHWYLKKLIAVDFINGFEEAFGSVVGMIGNFQIGKTLDRDGATVINDHNNLGFERQIKHIDTMLFHDTSDSRCVPPDGPQNQRRRRLDGLPSCTSKRKLPAPWWPMNSTVRNVCTILWPPKI